MEIGPAAITGIGIVSPYGLDKEQWFNALCQGTPEARPFEAFEAQEVRSRLAIRVQDFDAKAELGAKGLTHFGRTHLLAATAARLALSDAGPLPADFDLAKLGVIQAMTFGTIQNITGFYNEAISDGPTAVSPIGFANTVANSPASRTAILLGARGLNVTLAHGETAGLETLAYSAYHLVSGPERLILAGSGYGLCRDMYRAYGVRGLLSPGNNGGAEHNVPLDETANGVVLGEMAVGLALERPDRARSRDAKILGMITGHAQGFDPDCGRNPAQSARIVSRTMQRAIAKAGLKPGHITWVAAAANSHPRIDAIEARALKIVFGASSPTRVTAIKSMSGECFDVAGPQGVAAAVSSMVRSVVPPTAGLTRPRVELPSGCCSAVPESMAVHHVLVNVMAFSGGCSSMVVSSPEAMGSL
jgi:3-oxoacyl-[acyl-carrier-protein] synthase II